MYSKRVKFVPMLFGTLANRRVSGPCDEVTEPFALTRSIAAGLAIIALLTVAIAPRASWAFGSFVDSFTYEGTQEGFTPGTVYTLSTASTQLGFCTVTPQSDGSDGSYQAECFDDFGDGLIPAGAKYASVVYQGETNNPNNFFVVGDNLGSIFQMNLRFVNEAPSGEPVEYGVPGVRTVNKSPTGCPGDVANLAMDPSGDYLYVGCYVNNTTFQWTEDSNYSLPGYLLLSFPVNADGTLGTVRRFTDIFPFLNTSSSGITPTAGMWKDVKPVMRAYPAGHPGLKGSGYETTGAVMVSGLIGGLSPDPVASGVICSQEQCVAAYNHLSGNKSLITAAEIGLDYFQTSGTFQPSLYWNQVSTRWANPCAVDGFFCPEPTIDWSSTSNTLWSCNLEFSPIGSQSSSCGGGSYSLDWETFRTKTGAGDGEQRDITNLVYLPQPEITTIFKEGLLVIGTWTNGHLAYHSPEQQTPAVEGLLSEESLNNVNAIISDGNGNVMFETGSQALFVFNPFPTDINLQALTDKTLIAPAANSDQNGPGTLKKIVTDVKIAYNVASKIGELVAAEPPPSDAVNGGALVLRRELEAIFGPESLLAQFVYKEAQLRQLGVDSGVTIRGIRLRQAPGRGAAPSSSLKVENLTLRLSTPRSQDGEHALRPKTALNKGKKRVTVFKGDLFVDAGSYPPHTIYPDSLDNGPFGPTIWFKKPYSYEGGDLLVEVSHKGSDNGDGFLFDAYATNRAQGIEQRAKDKIARTYNAIPVVQFILEPSNAPKAKGKKARQLDPRPWW